jgi:hypothetical protein
VEAEEKTLGGALLKKKLAARLLALVEFHADLHLDHLERQPRPLRRERM